MVAPSGRGKARFFKFFRKTKAPFINIGLELHKSSLNSMRDKEHFVNRLISNLLNTFIQILYFWITLKSYSNHLFSLTLSFTSKLSRSNHCCCMEWRVKDGDLIYAAPEHPEYRRYPIHDLTIITLRMQ